MGNDMIVVCGAGGFIGGALVAMLVARGESRVRAVDIKPLDQWQRRTEGVEELCGDLCHPETCARAVAGCRFVYNFAADMGGMGFIETSRIACMRNVLINTHLVEAASAHGAEGYFFASSACVYNTTLQARSEVVYLKESDAYPAMAERGYGWEKLFSEMVCQEYTAERGLKTFIARLHNVYGPYGTWCGGREKAPAAISRKVLEAVHEDRGRITIWGNGQQVRSFMYIDDCLAGIARIIAEPSLVATPVNLGQAEAITIDDLVTLCEGIAGVRLIREYDHTAPQGVKGRSSDNTLLRARTGWEPSIPMAQGLRPTYRWIEQQWRGALAQRGVAS
jgi:nucleoside-diphosphate-sugar epimerase